MLQVSWGVKSLDNALGMIRGGTLTLFYGNAGTGKTTLASMVPIMRIIQEYGKPDENDVFIIIDTEGGFDVERFKQILHNNGIDFDEIKHNIEYYEVTEFDEQHSLIKNLPKMLKDEGKKPLLVSVDTITSIYRGIILRTPLKNRLATIGEYTGKIDLQVSYLRRIAVKYGIPVYITTWSSSRVGEQLTTKDNKEPIPPEAPFIGGRLLTFMPKVIAELRMPDRFSPVRQLILWKSRDRPAGLQATFKLCDAGIEGVENG